MQTQVVLDETGIHYSRGRHECGSSRMTPELLGIVESPRRQSLRKYYFFDFYHTFRFVPICL